MAKAKRTPSEAWRKAWEAVGLPKACLVLAWYPNAKDAPSVASDDLDPEASHRDFEVWASRQTMKPEHYAWPDGLPSKGVATLTLYTRGSTADARRDARHAIEDAARESLAELKARHDKPAAWYALLAADAIRTKPPATVHGSKVGSPGSILIADVVAASLKLKPSVAKRRKKAAPGESAARVAAALIKHHDCNGETVGNFEPISPTVLAKLAGVPSVQTAATLYKNNWGSTPNYRDACRKAELTAMELERFCEKLCNLLGKDTAGAGFYGADFEKTGL